jgi:hypothetical protein
MPQVPRLLRHIWPVAAMLRTLVVDAGRFLRLWLRSPAQLAAEHLFLRKQLALYQERHVKPRRATKATRYTLVWLGQWFDWRHALSVVQPETFTRWHRQGFRLFWRWKSRPDRPQIPEPLTSRVASLQKDRYVLPDHLGVVTHPILCGLHHDYALKTRAA